MLTQPALQAIVFVQNFVARIRDEERGATAVEYGLMVAAIAAVIIAIVWTLGGQVQKAFQDVSDGWHA